MNVVPITVAPASVRTDQQTVISTRAPTPAPNAASQAELGQTLLGQKLDHFELLEFVGGGGMGVVFKALDTRLNRIVALKVLARDQADEEEKVRRFQNEAQSAARLDHDHIARVYFVGQDCGLHYIVFEYIEGINLRDLVERKGPLSLDEAVSFTLQVAEALAHASSRDVVHRDIKPSNLLITPQGRAKLVDMGLARLHQVEHSQNDLTSSGVTLGTFDYISPEQARDPRSADVRSDIYSLGCTLYFMLTARPPFPEGNVLQKLLQHNNDPPPDPADCNPELPESVSRLVRKMLAKDPRKRHQRASELVAELLHLVDTLGLSTQGLESLSWSTPKPSRYWLLERHLPWVAPVVLLCAIVLVLDLWSPTPDKRPGEPPRNNAALAPIPTPAVSPQEDRGQRNAATGDEEPRVQDRSPPSPTPPSAVVQAPPAEAEPAVPMPAAVAAPLEQPVVHPLAVSAEQGVGLKPEDSRGGISLAGDSSAALTADIRPLPAEAALRPTQSPVTAPPPDRSSAAMETPARMNVLVVNPYGTAPHELPSLRAACVRAKETGVDVIELKYNGRLQEKPIRLDNLKLTIRAAENYQPVVVFRPKESSASDLQSMITVIGGQLTLMNVALELDVPGRREPESWSLVETQRPELLRLERCSLTIRNASQGRMALHPTVAFFDIKAPPGSGAMAMDNAVAAEHTVNLQLVNTIARGEANFLRCDDLQSVSVLWTNGLLATSERLLTAAGGDMATRQTGLISLDLRHVTAAVQGGLCMLTNSESGRPMPHTDVKCADSILLASAGAVLVEQFGVSSSEEFQDLFSWSSNRCFFQGFSTFWKISTLGTSQDPLERGFAEWQDFWSESAEMNFDWQQVAWKKPPDLSRPFHTHTVADYALGEQGADNHARRAATDGLDAGLIAEELPPLPGNPGVESVSPMPMPMPPMPAPMGASAAATAPSE